eukprot:6358071-Alexandrium_andersonii.AAC.1
MNDAKLRRTQGIKYYVGDARLAEEALLAKCLETVNSQRHIVRRAQGLAPVPPRGEGMFTFPD